MKVELDKMDHSRALGRLTFRGSITLAALLIAIFAWAAQANITGAVVASGQFVVSSNVKKVQHPTGGVVGSLKVEEGDPVIEGQVLLSLDETVTRASLVGVIKKIDELTARQARLNAERRNFATLKFPKELQRRRSDAEVDEILSTEAALFDARKTSHLLRKSRLGERVRQLENELVSLQANLRAKRKLALITAKELIELRRLKRRQLVSTQRFNAVDRESVNVATQVAQTIADIAKTEGKIVETKMQSDSLDDELRAETTKELRETQAELAQYVQKKIAALDEMKRTIIRSPISGVVHQLNVHTVGGVVTSAEPIMLIVPSGDQLELKVQIKPHDIDQLHIGQSAAIRINAFNRRTTPLLEGTVTHISADVSRETYDDAPFYSARLSVEESELHKLQKYKLQAGMQAEALIRTSQRTPLEYLARPFWDQMHRAFRER